MICTVRFFPPDKSGLLWVFIHRIVLNQFDKSRRQVVLGLPAMTCAIDLNQDLAKRFLRWLRIQEYSQETNRHYKSSIVSLCRFISDMPVTDLTHLDVRDFLASVAQRGVKRATIWRAMSALRCFFDFLNMGGLIAWSPPRFVCLPQINRPPYRVLSEKQMRSLSADARDLKERTMIEVFYGTGARAGELQPMQVEDVDLEARRIRVLGKCGFRYALFPRGQFTNPP